MQGAPLLLGSVAAAASCAEDSGPAGSPVVFVGTAGEERGGYTKFQVSEVWHGPDLAPEVWVLTGQEQPPWPLNVFLAVGSSTDASLSAGDTYVIGATDGFTTNECSIAATSSAAVDPLRPGEVRPPAEDGSTGADPPLGPLGQAVPSAAVVAAMIGLLVVRTRRHDRTGTS